jgi:PilZ domain-containing protein
MRRNAARSGWFAEVCAKSRAFFRNLASSSDPDYGVIDRQRGCRLHGFMSDPHPDSEFIVSMPDASLDDLFAGLEASIKPAEPEAEPRKEDPAPVSARPERRRSVRREAHEFKMELRLAVAGFPMKLVNLSSTGLLAETSQRLCPGRTVDVFLRYGGIRRVLRATVIRSSMHAVAPTPIFRAALQFEDVLTLQDADL